MLKIEPRVKHKIKACVGRTLSWTFIASIAFIGGFQVYRVINTARYIITTPKVPPVYRDVNGDGVEDKIIQEKVEDKGIFSTRYYTLEDKVLFGVEVNGEKLYLPEDQFEEYQK